jgi:hypothetical protein
LTYDVNCACGRLVSGQRLRAHQVVACPSCGRTHFVFPLGPWAEGVGAHGKGGAFRSVGRLPLVLVIVGLVLALAALPLVWSSLKRPATPDDRATTPERIREAMQAARQALADGKYQLALRTLDAALADRDRQPEALAPVQHRHLNQLHRQADLLARLSILSLEEIARRASRVRDPAERRAEFDFHHRGKSVVFDSFIGADPRGRPVLRGYKVRIEDEPVRIALEELNLFQGRLLEPPRRFLFGGRLAECELEEGGTWVIRFEPGSGVLLTDAGAVKALLPGPWAQEQERKEFEELLQGQQAWVDKLSGLKPAAP